MVASLSIPVAIFFAARSAASWRPQFIGIQSMTHFPATIRAPTPAIDGSHLTLSPNGEWLHADHLGAEHIWNTTTGTSRACDLQQVQFSRDSRALIGLRIRPFVQGAKVGHTFSVVLQTPEGKEVWATAPQLLSPEGPPQLQFAGDTFEAVTASHIYNFDLQTGATRRISKRPSNMQISSAWSYADKFKSPDGSKIYSLSPIRSSPKRPTGKYQVDVSTARNSKKLWSYPTPYSWNMMACYPQWEEGGEALATIESNTLFLRDAQTGKPLITYKSHLPAPLESWAFTKNRDMVYLMDSKGRIYRQRLR